VILLQRPLLFGRWVGRVDRCEIGRGQFNVGRGSVFADVIEIARFRIPLAFAELPGALTEDWDIRSVRELDCVHRMKNAVHLKFTLRFGSASRGTRAPNESSL
jgi:hypothetical protein